MPPPARPAPPPVLALLAQRLRWRLLAALGGGDRRVQELMAVVGEPANLVSYHLRRLRQHGLVRERRSSADGRDVYYSLDLDRLARLYAAAGASLHPALAAAAGGGGHEQRHPALAVRAGRARRPPRVLFVCTHNSARSQMAEALLRHLGAGRIESASAGTEPSRVHPLAVRTMAREGIDIRAQRAKGLAQVGRRRSDLVVTVCDLAREACSELLAGSEARHWSLADPAAVAGGERSRQRAFQDTARELRARVGLLIASLQADR